MALANYNYYMQILVLKMRDSFLICLAAFFVGYFIPITFEIVKISRIVQSQNMCIFKPPDIQVSQSPIIYNFAMFNESNDFNITNFTQYSSVFKIHGLWPQAYPTTNCTSCVSFNNNPSVDACTSCIDCVGKNWPQWCDNTTQFNISALQENTTLWNQIIELYEPNPAELLEHEWIKHGTCTQFSQVDYFVEVVNTYYLVYDQQMKIGEFCTHSDCFCANSNLSIVVIV